MRAGTRIGLAVVLVALAATGCTSKDPGTASPNTSSTAPSASIPPRPKDLAAATVDPCTLVTSSQQTQLKVSSGGPGPGDSQTGAKSSCSYDVTDPVGYTISVQVDPSRGIEYWLNTTGTWVARQTAVASYPAVQTVTKGEDWNQPAGSLCETMVSTANGQELSVGVLPHEKDLTNTQLCDLSKQVAGLAMATLQAKS